MAAANLEHPELLRCCFESGASVVGAFRSFGLWDYPGYHNWHFAGTWFTFRNSRAFSLGWRNVRQDYMGVEAWPGIFPPGESRCLFYDHANTAHLYDLNFWEYDIAPSLRWWRRLVSEAARRRGV
jgi:hypothetical protein